MRILPTATRFMSLLFLVAIVSCKSSETQKHKTEPTAEVHNSMNSVDWVGSYTGSMPCNGCAGIHTKLELMQDNHYRLERRFLGKTTEPEIQEGTFSWNKEGTTITLDNTDKTKIPSYYLVNENKLIQLDLSGNKITGDQSDRYNMIKQDPVAERHWKLTQLNGNNIVLPSDEQTEIFMVLQAAEGTVHGKGGCNSFNGSYNLSGNTIKFGAIASTRMACPYMDTESAFFECLQQSAKFKATNEKLQLFTADNKPLAEFVAVYIK